MAGIVPYQSHVESYDLDSPLLPVQSESLPGQAQCILLNVDHEAVDFMIEKFEQWFAKNDEVVLVAYGKTHTGVESFILLEWHEWTINPLFISIMENEESCNDACIWLRPLGGDSWMA